MKTNIEKNKIILTLLSILFFLIFFKTFHNVYVIVRNDYAARLTNNYGYCDKQGYGFVSSTIIKNGIKDTKDSYWHNCPIIFRFCWLVDEHGR